MKIISSPRYLLNGLISMLFLVSCSSDNSVKELQISNNENRAPLPNTVLKLRNESSLKMRFFLTVSADLNNDSQALEDDFFLVQEVELDAYESVDLTDFASTTTEGISLNGDTWDVIQNGNLIGQLVSTDSNIFYGTFLNGFDSSDGYYCQWKLMKGDIFGTYQDPIQGNFAFLLSTQFGGYSSINNPINYFYANGNTSPYFSNSSINIGSGEIKVVIDPVQ